MFLHSSQGDEIAIGICPKTSLATYIIIQLYDCMLTNKCPREPNLTFIYKVQVIFQLEESADILLTEKMSQMIKLIFPVISHLYIIYYMTILNTNLKLLNLYLNFK